VNVSRLRWQVLVLVFPFAWGGVAFPEISSVRNTAAEKTVAGSGQPRLYRLGPGDLISVQQPNAEELDGKTARIDAEGFASLPLVGRVRLGGLTIQEGESLLTSRLSDLLLKPQPIISVEEYRSQPVSVVGAVNNPGVIQLQGKKTLLETISLAGGLRPDAGGQVEITRQLANGRLPLSGEKLDPTGGFSTATIDIAKVVNGANPAENILICPDDVISIPRAEMVYVTGEVHKPGGFPLNTGGAISVLQALSLAEGLGPQAAPKSAKIFRPRGDGSEKDEIPVNVAAILKGKTADFNLKARDVLFIPDSTSKKAGVRAAEAAVETVTGVIIWRR